MQSSASTSVVITGFKREKMNPRAPVSCNLPGFVCYSSDFCRAANT